MSKLLNVRDYISPTNYIKTHVDHNKINFGIKSFPSELFLLLCTDFTAHFHDINLVFNGNII